MEDLQTPQLTPSPLREFKVIEYRDSCT